MRFRYCLFPLFFLTLFLLPAEEKRSFDEIFPELPPAIRKTVFSSEGYYNSTGSVLPAANTIDPHMVETVFSIQPDFLVESVLVIPDTAGRYSLLDVYNALGKIRGLKGQLYHSHTRDEYVPLFEDVTRIESAQKNVPIDDPAPASGIPPSETIYMRLKDANFGNSYYRGNITQVRHGLRYSLSNNKTLTYFFVPVIKEEKFTAQLYFEPISEGILIYGLAGADVSDFVSSRIDMSSAIGKRLAVIIAWAADGIIKGGT